MGSRSCLATASLGRLFSFSLERQHHSHPLPPQSQGRTSPVGHHPAHSTPGPWPWSLAARSLGPAEPLPGTWPRAGSVLQRQCQGPLAGATWGSSSWMPEQGPLDLVPVLGTEPPSSAPHLPGPSPVCVPGPPQRAPSFCLEWAAAGGRGAEAIWQRSTAPACEHLAKHLKIHQGHKSQTQETLETHVGGGL